MEKYGIALHNVFSLLASLVQDENLISRGLNKLWGAGKSYINNKCSLLLGTRDDFAIHDTKRC